MRDEGNAVDASETTPVGMGAASTGVAVTQGSASTIGSGKFACDACDGIGTDDDAWECACTLVPAYGCGTDGVAKLRVCVRLDIDGEATTSTGNASDGDETTDGDTANTLDGTNAGMHGECGRHIRAGYVRTRLRDPRIGLTSKVEHPLYVSEDDGRCVTAEDVVHEVMRSIVTDDRDDVLAWAKGFGSIAVQQTFRKYGDWWRSRGAMSAIRATVNDDARIEIDQCDTRRFPMKAHAIVYPDGGEAFEVWARFDGHAHATVTRD